MNTSTAIRIKPALLFERDAEVRAGWGDALVRNQFSVRALPPQADPVFSVALLQAAGQMPTLVIAALSYFAGRNRNPYQFAKRLTGNFPETSLMLVQSPGQPVTEAMRAVARRYGAIDLAPAAPGGEAAAAMIETLRLSASAQAPHDGAREAPVLGIEQQVAVQLRRQMKINSAGAFRASDALARAEKFSVSREQITAWLDLLVRDGSLRSLSGESSFIPGDGWYRFFTDEPVAGSSGEGDKMAAPKPALAVDPRKISDVDLYQLAAEMRAGAVPLDIRDRSYRFSSYPACFIAAEAVGWMAQHRGMTRPQAVKVGERMFENGLFHHVTDDHDFKDGNFFFRFFADEPSIGKMAAKQHAPDIGELDVTEVAGRMRGAGGVEVGSRRYLLKTYPKCFTGIQAVNWLAENFQLSRPLAVKLGERMLEAGILHHVADDHDFKDGEFFYRYYADE